MGKERLERLKLPEVTLVCVETREHDLARLAIEDCLRVAEFGEVLILTDRPSEFWSLTNLCQPSIHNVPDWPNKIGWSRSWWFDVPPLLHTRQTLNIQWDSWIWNADLWRDDWLYYDYIGAPWWYSSKNVGNGGFSLVSTRLKRYIHANRDRFPCNTSVDDDLLCRKYRPQLEDAGFVWAPEKIAHDFSIECCRPSPDHRSFGFHGCFNWSIILDHDSLIDRARRMMASPNLQNSMQMRAFCEKNPAVIKELLDDESEPALMT